MKKLFMIGLIGLISFNAYAITQEELNVIANATAQKTSTLRQAAGKVANLVERVVQMTAPENDLVLSGINWDSVVQTQTLLYLEDLHHVEQAADVLNTDGALTILCQLNPQFEDCP